MYSTFLSSYFVSVSFHSKMAMFGQIFSWIVKIFQYFIIVRFFILHPDVGSDELWRFLLLQGIWERLETIMMSTWLFFSRLTRAGLTPPSLISCLLSLTMRSAKLSVVCVSKTTSVIHSHDYVLNIQDKAGCEGWTWLSETSADYPEHCLMFSSLGDIENYPNCVREGPIYKSK